MKTLIAIVLVVCCIFTTGVVFAESQNTVTRYEMREIQWCGLETYKGYPTDWWVTYFIKEFDTYAPPPGVDWVTASTINGRRSLGPRVSDFVYEAGKNGWIVKHNPKDAAIGALALKYNADTGLVFTFIVRKVYDDRVLVTFLRTINGLGQPEQRELTFEQLGREADGYKFLGYIWPSKN
ncbi:MAG: hypothetical protein P4N41_22835 [Negativicutes bacterium]|nr:hypothetical protein [Negativicutes bacterium]